MNAIDKLKEAKGILSNAGIENPERDAESAACHIASESRGSFFTETIRTFQMR